MQLLAHRGLWHDAAEKNTPLALERGFAAGFGAETDVRDHDGQLVIAHDMPRAHDLPFSSYRALLDRHARGPLTQALNVKADGLAEAIARAMREVQHPWFVFDMSVPDTLQQLRAGNPVYVRMSEHEPFPDTLRQRVRGVWLDAFESTWYGPDLVAQLLSQGLQVCVVSPELHRRSDHLAVWQTLRGLRQHAGLSLCTDWPHEAAQAIGL
jgi:hypothetical protein